MEPVPPRLAKDIMTTNVVTLDESEQLDQLGEALKSFRFRHMPVVQGDRLVGMTTQRDLLRISASSLIPHRSQQDAFLQQRFRVRDIMTEEVQSARPDTPLTELAERMRSGNLGCVPIVDSQQRVVGIVTEADFVKLAQTLLKLLDPPL
jgi:CBS-domain-containing membrane protein